MPCAVGLEVAETNDQLIVRLRSGGRFLVYCKVQMSLFGPCPVVPPKWLPQWLSPQFYSATPYHAIWNLHCKAPPVFSDRA